MRWIPRVWFSLSLLGLLLGEAHGGPPAVRVVIFPFGPTVMIAHYLVDAGLWKKWGERFGVEFSLAFARDDFARFSERQADVIQLSPLEVARAKGEEGWEWVMWGRDGTASQGLYVRNDSKVGSIQELKGSTLVHPGWDTGTTQLAQILFRHWFGLELGRDFRLVSVPWEVGPRMVAEGGAAGGLSLMPYTLNPWRDKTIRPLLASYAEEWAKRRGTGHPLAMGLWVSWAGWLGRHEGAARALLGAWAEGMAYAHTRTEEWSKRYLGLTLPGAGNGQVRFFAEWFEKSPPTYRTPYLDETFIQEEEAFLNLALKANLIKSRGLQGIWRIIK